MYIFQPPIQNLYEEYHVHILQQEIKIIYTFTFTFFVCTASCFSDELTKTICRIHRIHLFLPMAYLTFNETVHC